MGTTYQFVTRTFLIRHNHRLHVLDPHARYACVSNTVLKGILAVGPKDMMEDTGVENGAAIRANLHVQFNQYQHTATGAEH